MIKILNRISICVLITGSFLLTAEAGFGQSQSGSVLLASYDVHWQGLKIMSIESRTEMSVRRYSQAMTLRTRGLLKLFVDGRTVASAEGRRVENGGLIPERFESEGQWDEDYYLRRLTYDGNGKPSEIVLDMPEDWLDRDPVPEALQEALDPLSLVLYAISDPWKLVSGATADSPAQPRAGAMDTFDGIRSMSYNITCDATPKKVKKRRRTIYQGPAYLCRLSGRQTGGFWRGEDEDRKADDDEEEELEVQSIRMWLVPAPEAGILVPVIIELSSGRGKVKIFLKEINQLLVLDDEGTDVRLSP